MVTMKITDECDVKLYCLVEVYLNFSGLCCLHYQGKSGCNCNSAFLSDCMALWCRRTQSQVHCIITLLFPLVVKDHFQCLSTTFCSHARGFGIQPVMQGPYVVCKCFLSLPTLQYACWLLSE